MGARSVTRGRWLIGTAAPDVEPVAYMFDNVGERVSVRALDSVSRVSRHTGRKANKVPATIHELFT